MSGRENQPRERIIKARTEKGYTQGAVAAMVGIAQPSYFAIEKGKSTPRPETAKKIGAVLGIPWAWFYEDEEESAE